MVTKLSKPGVDCMRNKIVRNLVGNLTPDFLEIPVAPAWLMAG
jgi:hypothetical protein